MPKRIEFHEITNEAVRRALESRATSTCGWSTPSRRAAWWTGCRLPAQPVPLSKVQKGIGAGRVQSVALRLVVRGLWRFPRIRGGLDLLVYTIFYFPGLLMASAAMRRVPGRVRRSGRWPQDRTFLLVGSFALLFVAVVLNIIGLNVGKWLQNAGGVSTYIPLLMLVGIATVLWFQPRSVTHFTWANMMPPLELGTR